MKINVIDIECFVCKNKKLEYVKHQNASDYSYTDLTFHCYECGTNTTVEYVPHHAELG